MNRPLSLGRLRGRSAFMDLCVFSPSVVVLTRVLNIEAGVSLLV